jgi:hypothetical protein
VYVEVVRADGQLPHARAQYASAEARERAVAALDGAPPAPGALPLRVLPFVDRRLAHAPAGLLQLNELPPDVSVAALGAAHARAAPVLAAAIAPTWCGQRVGFVLFQRFEDAQRAAGDARNALLHPPGDPALLIAGFAESERAAANCLAVYGLPPRITDREFEAQCQDAAQPISVALRAAAGGPKSGFAYFSNRRALAAAYARFAAAGATVEVLHGNALVHAARALRARELPAAWAACLVFLKRLPQISNADLFTALSAYGRVTAAFQNVSPDTGLWAGNGIALFAQDAAPVLLAAAEGQIRVDGQAIAATPFRATFAGPPARTQFRLPDQAASPRDWLRKLAQLNLPAEELDGANAKISALTIDQTYGVTRYPPEQILQWFVAKG